MIENNKGFYAAELLIAYVQSGPFQFSRIAALPSDDERDALRIHRNSKGNRIVFIVRTHGDRRHDKNLMAVADTGLVGFCSADHDAVLTTLDYMHEQIRGSGFVLILADEEGYILYMQGDRDIVEIANRNGLAVGANRSEKRLGTSGIGTVLVTGKPLQVFGAEHYYGTHSNWVCSGAPVFLPSGDLGGVVCLSGMAGSVSSHTTGLVAAAADAISRQIKLKELYDQQVLMTKKLDLIIETVPNAVALLNGKLQITAFNHRLADLLQKSSEELMELPVSDLFARGSVSEADIRRGFQDRNAQLAEAFRSLPVSISLQKAGQTDFYLQLVPLSVLHRRVNRIFGNDAHFSFSDIIGESPQIREAVRLAKIAAANDATVLIQGESGTGKELFAQSIHNASDRRGGPFIAVNCGAIPKSLIESELFGYESGSFTGARKEGAPGKFELADGGTIFLDEIDGMSFDVQVALLRVLQNREIQRIGARAPQKIDVRVISASNQNLEQLIRDHQFRQDLFFRLNVFDIKIPPLRERGTDIRVLSDFFLKKYAATAPGETAPVFTEEASGLLMQYSWEGNVRQLENTVERAVYLSSGGFITPDCLPQELRHGSIPAKSDNGSAASEAAPASGQAASPDPSMPGPQSFQDREAGQIREALAYTHGNVREAAGLLGINRRTLYRKMDLYHIDCNAYR